MKNKIALSLLIMVNSFLVLAQKRELDSGVYRHWPQTGEASISGDGHFVAYQITNPMGSPNQLVIQATNSLWNTSFMSQHPLNTHAFTFDSRYAVFMKAGDTLEMIDLQTRRSHELSGVKTLDVQPMGHWMACFVITPVKQYMLSNSITGEQVRIDSAERLELPQQGNVVYYWVNSGTSASSRKTLYALDLASHLAKCLWTGIPSGKLRFSDDGTKVAFTGKSDDSIVDDIWYYHAGSATKVASLGFDRLTRKLHIKLLSVVGFEQAGKALSVITQRDTIMPAVKKINMVSLDVWSYTDPSLQSAQPATAPPVATCHALLSLDGLDYIPIARENEKILFKTLPYTVVEWSDPRADWDERAARWYPYGVKRYYLVSNKDGTRRRLPENLQYYYPVSPSLSPQGKYLVFVDTAGNYCSYSTATGKVTNLTKNVTADWLGIWLELPFAKFPRDLKNILWTRDDRSVLLGDRYDIWELDPEGEKPAVNITNGYGKRTHTRFDVALRYQPGEVRTGAQLILEAFNTSTKESGYFKAVLGGTGDPIRLCMGSYHYYNGPDYGIGIGAGLLPGLQNAGLFLVGRMSADESPNYFVTRDFKSFKPVTDVCPEKAYDWPTTELVNWKQADGTSLQGVLYKPKNFDPCKRYPLLFYYYEDMSDYLNVYQTPGPSAGGGETMYRLNAPFYTANGYLVFYPDILKKVGAPGKSACDALVSAARFLSQRPYIDSTRLGLFGISYGSYETDYIITHSNLFAAASSLCGFSDIFLASGELKNLDNGKSFQEYIVSGQQAMGQYLWENPQLYLENSPVAYSDRVSTPLLMMYNKGDALNFVHGVAFFTALRTLGKKAWLLQYDKGDHGIYLREQPDEAIDFDIRLKQFYDFYLKGKPAPLWMLDGIPAYLKGTKTDLELDTTGRVPGPGLPQLRMQMEQKANYPYHKFY